MLIQSSYKGEVNSFYVIPTPIGNLEDITLRAINTLKNIDLLYCEDKRITQKLLNKLDIKVTLYTFNEYSYDIKKEEILKFLNEGKNIGFVSDAGMPGICDPGFKIIRYLKENKQNVIILPGPSAFIIPMVYHSLNDKDFTFKGFLSKKKSVYKEQLKEICNSDINNIIYETPHRLLTTLEEIEAINKDIQILITREISKIYEQYIEGSVKELVAYIKEKGVKGEIILIIAPSGKKIEIDYIKEVDKLVLEGMKKTHAIKEVSFKYNISKNKIYNDYINKDSR